MTEKRKHKRFNVEIGSLLVLEPRSREKLGDILNLSRGGLAYRYVPDTVQPLNSFEIDIFWVPGDSSFLNNVPCITISDSDAARRFPIDRNKYRLRGVQFRELAESQISRLEFCILKYTITEQ